MKTLVLVRGGLGNQMFQVAYGEGLRQRLNADVSFVDFSQDARVKRDWGLSVFGIQRTVLGGWRWSLVRWAVILSRRLQDQYGFSLPPALCIEPELGGFRPWPSVRPWIVDGYWQQASYLQPLLPRLRTLFSADLGAYSQGLQEWRSRRRPLVAMHVRRGDYVSDPAAAMHLVCDVGYYERACSEMLKRVPDAQFVVFSDDMNWVRGHISLPADTAYALASKDQPAWVDLMLMRCCDHFVISNSSYSWWAAFLSEHPGKQVIAPDHWLVGVTTRSIGICPEDWLLLG